MAKTVAKNDVEKGQACAALSYLFPVGLIWYLIDEEQKKNKFVQFHVRQSLVAAIFIVAGYIAASIFNIINVGYVISMVVSIAMLVWFIQGLVYSLSGKEEELFLIGHIGKTLKI